LSPIPEILMPDMLKWQYDTLQGSLTF